MSALHLESFNLRMLLIQLPRRLLDGSSYKNCVHVFDFIVPLFSGFQSRFYHNIVLLIAASTS